MKNIPIKTCLLIKFMTLLILFFHSICFSETKEVESKNDLTEIKAILFDTFGTVVDWQSSITQEFNDAFIKNGIKEINISTFVSEWVQKYPENVEKINAGEIPFATLDDLNLRELNFIFKKYNISNFFTPFEVEQLSQVWHRLKPWPDSVSGINELKKYFIVGTLSNGNVKLLIDLSKYGNLNWDVILSGELFKIYKPDPRVYLGAAEILRLKPENIMLVAAHEYDLDAAKKIGYKTAFITRQTEYSEQKENNTKEKYDIVTNRIDLLPILLRPF